MNEVLWLMITADHSGRLLEIRMLADRKSILEAIQEGTNIACLREFTKPMEAMAMKHLLDDLSRPSVINFVRLCRSENLSNIRRLSVV